MKWHGIGIKWGGFGIKWTGALLALPALVPVVVLVALALVVVAVRKWKPTEGRWPAHAMGTLANFPWIRRAEELLVSDPAAGDFQGNDHQHLTPADDSNRFVIS